MKIQYALALLAWGLVGCQNDDDTTPPPATAAGIRGTVNLYDDRTTSLDNAGMTVTAEGTTPLIRATTSASGEFTLANVPTGRYTLAYEKTDYGTYRLFNVDHNAATGTTTLTRAPSLGKVSTTRITALTATPDGSEVLVSATTDPAGSANGRRYVRFFLHTASTVSSSTYTAYTDVFSAGFNPFAKVFTQAELVSLGFSAGATVWVRAYGDAYFSNDYDDPGTNRRVFPNVNPTSTAAVSFRVP